LVLYETPALIMRMQENAMRLDFSWKRTAESYLKAYQQALNSKR
jgi:glycogen synthase